MSEKTGLITKIPEHFGAIYYIIPTFLENVFSTAALKCSNIFFSDTTWYAKKPSSCFTSFIPLPLLLNFEEEEKEKDASQKRGDPYSSLESDMTLVYEKQS